MKTPQENVLILAIQTEKRYRSNLNITYIMFCNRLSRNIRGLNLAVSQLVHKKSERFLTSFPRDGEDVYALRGWLDKKGYNDKFIGWEPDTLLSVSETTISEYFGPQEKDMKNILLGLLETARRDRDRGKPISFIAFDSILSFHL